MKLEIQNPTTNDKFELDFLDIIVIIITLQKFQENMKIVLVRILHRYSNRAVNYTKEYQVHKLCKLLPIGGDED